jgi:uncharacterized protein (TIGR03118 family)
VKQYVQKNLASDVAGVGLTVNPNLVNPWGLVQSPSGQWWTANNAKGVITLSTREGMAYPSSAPVIITVPLPPGTTGIPSAPTGIALNDSADFTVGPGKPAARVICVTEDGTISGWNPEVDKYHAVLAVDRSTQAVYKGVALGRMRGRNYLYAANFWAGTIDVFDAYFHQVDLPDGAFVDSLLPEDFAPSNVQNINGRIYVAYAQQDVDSYDPVRGAGLGYVTVYDESGKLISRLKSGPELNAPWGMTLAPPGFGRYGNMLLVGNAGDGTIAIYDPAIGEFKGHLEGMKGDLITIQGLRGIAAGNNASAGSAAEVYFCAGVEEGEHGLFGLLKPGPPTK